MKKIRLTSICSPKQWRTIPTKDLLDEGYPVYGANGVIGYCKEYNHTSDTIIIGCRGSCGNVNIARGKSYINGNAMCLDDLSSDVDILYLYYFLQNYDFRSVISGTTIPQVTKQGLEKIDVVVSSKENQREIVRQLQLLDSIIEERHKELRYFDALIKSRFIEMFVANKNVCNWSQVSISDVSTNMRTGPFGSALHHDEFVDSGVFVLGIDNAVENRFSYNRMRYITEEKYNQLKRYTVYPGDVIITIMGTVGRSAVIPQDMPKAINTKHLACITPDSAVVDPCFLSLAFQMHPAIRLQLQNQCKGAIMDGLNLTIIKGLRFQLPPIDQQKQFSEFVEQTDKSKYHGEFTCGMEVAA